jgi:hypothetical protein
MEPRRRISKERVALHDLFSIAAGLLNNQSPYLSKLPDMDVEDIEFLSSDYKTSEYDSDQDTITLVMTLKLFTTEFADAQNASNVNCKLAAT